MTEAPVIRTARLTLRPHRLSDWEPIAAFFASDAARYVGGPLRRAGAPGTASPPTSAPGACSASATGGST